MKPSPAVCPECGTALDIAAHCGNPDCPSNVRERIKHWCGVDAMEIAISHPLIDQLVARGLLLDVADLYRLRWSELRQFEEMNEESIETLLASIEASTSREWRQVFYGLGISGIDAATAALLTQKFRSVEELAAASRIQLTAKENVSEAVAQNLMRWFGDPQHRKVIKRLRQAGLNLG
jgi:DNA ligase (NAD+)